MKTDEMNIMVNILKEMNESYADLLQAVKGTIKEVKSTRQLWHNGKEPRLIKLGLALIVFPEPTPISETIGSCLVAAGAIQKGIQKRAIHIGDVYKTFQNVLKDVWAAKDNL